jgi:hypothetical protein
LWKRARAPSPSVLFLLFCGRRAQLTEGAEDVLTGGMLTTQLQMRSVWGVGVVSMLFASGQCVCARACVCVIGSGRCSRMLRNGLALGVVTLIRCLGVADAEPWFHRVSQQSRHCGKHSLTRHKIFPCPSCFHPRLIRVISIRAFPQRQSVRIPRLVDPIGRACPRLIIIHHQYDDPTRVHFVFPFFFCDRVTCALPFGVDRLP